MTFLYDRNPRRRKYFVLVPGLTEADGAPDQKFRSVFTTQAKWTSTVSSRLLVDAGVSVNRLDFTAEPHTSFDAVSHFDLLTTRRWNNSNLGTYQSDNLSNNVVGSVAYVTGSHSIKTGVAMKWGYARINQAGSMDIEQQYRNGVPASALIRNTPLESRAELGADRHLRADSWRMGRLTLNRGCGSSTERAAAEQDAAGRPGGSTRSFATVTPCRHQGHRAARRRLRSVRQREDGTQGRRRPLHGTDRTVVRVALQPDGVGDASVNGRT